MNTDRNTLLKIANLARLEIKESEEASILSDINRILTWVEKLKELDVEDVEPLTHITPDVNVMRDDIISETLPREIAMKNAPKQDGEHFRVPKVIE